MKINSQRFGSIEIREDRILTLKDGLLGFSNCKRFALLDEADDPTLPFKWLISVDNPEVGFLVTDPGIFFSDYIVDIPEDDRASLGLEKAEDVNIITLLTIPSDPKMITANLRGPIVINSKTMQAKQVILENSGYVTKHYIFLQATSGETTTTPTTETTDTSVAAMVGTTGTEMDVKTKHS